MIMNGVAGEVSVEAEMEGDGKSLAGCLTPLSNDFTIRFCTSVYLLNTINCKISITIKHAKLDSSWTVEGYN
jgi:hypothetical protein